MFEAVGWGKLCTEPHNFLIIGKLCEDVAVLLVPDGGGLAENAAAASVDIRFGFCFSITVPFVPSTAFFDAAEILLLWSLLRVGEVVVELASDEILSEFVAARDFSFFPFSS